VDLADVTQLTIAMRSLNHRLLQRRQRGPVYTGTVCGVEPAPPRPSLAMGVLTVVTALGVCAIAAAVMVPAMLGGVGAWPVLVAGCVLLTVALCGLWLVQKRRDPTLR
jgi:hypothetical protein